MEYVRNWKHKKAQNYAIKLLKSFGKPKCVLKDRLIWTKPYVNVTEVVVKDQELFNEFPSSHYEFVYSTSNIRLSSEQAAILAYISKSIIVDQLGGQVTVRHASLLQNQVTLGFVYDISIGRLFGNHQQLKEEYKYRIQNKIASKTAEYPLPN